MSWWDDEKPAMDDFMTERVRRPLPARVSWETDRTDRYNRAHWLVITELGEVEGETDLPAYNTIVDPSQGIQLGINMIGQMVDGSGLRVLEVGPDSIASAAGMVNDDTIVEVSGNNGAVGRGPADRRWWVSPLVSRFRWWSCAAIDTDRRSSLDYPAEAAPAAAGRRFPAPSRAGTRRAGSAEQYRHRVHAGGPPIQAADLAGAVRLHTADQRWWSTGSPTFGGMVEPDIEALLRWVAIDQDRTTMYGAELDIEVPAAP